MGTQDINLVNNQKKNLLFYSRDSIVGIEIGMLFQQYLILSTQTIYQISDRLFKYQPDLSIINVPDEIETLYFIEESPTKLFIEENLNKKFVVFLDYENEEISHFSNVEIFVKPADSFTYNSMYEYIRDYFVSEFDLPYTSDKINFFSVIENFNLLLETSAIKKEENCLSTKKYFWNNFRDYTSILNYMKYRLRNSKLNDLNFIGVDFPKQIRNYLITKDIFVQGGYGGNIENIPNHYITFLNPENSSDDIFIYKKVLLSLQIPFEFVMAVNFDFDHPEIMINHIDDKILLKKDLSSTIEDVPQKISEFLTTYYNEIVDYEIVDNFNNTYSIVFLEYDDFVFFIDKMKWLINPILVTE